MGCLQFVGVCRVPPPRGGNNGIYLWDRGEGSYTLLVLRDDVRLCYDSEGGPVPEGFSPGLPCRVSRTRRGWSGLYCLYFLASECRRFPYLPLWDLSDEILRQRLHRLFKLAVV